MNTFPVSRETLVEQLFSATTDHNLPTTLAACDTTTAPPPSRNARLRQVLGIAKELLMHDLQIELGTAPLMSSTQALRDWLVLRFAGLDHEVFLVAFLDAQNRLRDAETMFRGTLTQTSVYPREVVKAALAHNAAAVAFAHNHPSGVPEPSRADEALTATLKSALALVDVRVLDHFVVAGGRTLSFAERGLL